MNDPARTMLGVSQERWTDARLAATHANWNFLAQGVTFTRSNEATDGRHRYWSDAWAGYPAARDRLLHDIVARRVANPVVLSGDIHAFIVADLPRDPADPLSPIGLSELVTTSITSPGPPDFVVAAYQRMKPQVWYADGDHRGYIRLELTRRELSADLVAVDDARRADSGAKVLARYAIESGKPGLRPL
jgi:alkaline phosphatase D